jgi:hypothetical protein
MRAITFLLSVAVCQTAHAAESYLSFEAGYRSGDFGTDVTTELNSYTLELGITGSQLGASVSIPFLSLSDDAGNSASGMGDIVLRGGYTYTFINPQMKDVSLTGSISVKMPTADEQDGLGTGQADVGAFVSLAKQWGTLKGSINAGYIEVGDPADIDYNNILLYGIGLFKRIDLLGLYMSLEGRSSLTDETDNPLEVNAGALYLVSHNYGLTGSGFVGLTNGSPDFGASLGLIRWF